MAFDLEGLKTGLYGASDALTGGNSQATYLKLKQDAAQWKDQEAKRQAELQQIQAQAAYYQAQGMSEYADQGYSPVEEIMAQAKQAQGAMMSLPNGQTGDVNGKAMGGVDLGKYSVLNTPYGIMARPADWQGKQREVMTMDPLTGEIINTQNVPASAKIYKGVMTGDQIKERAVAEGEGKAIQKDIETTSKLGTAVKRLAILNKQFNKALPSGDRTPIEQRIYGNVEAFKAKYGFSDNKELLALQQNIRPMAINLIRAFGEVGNLSETEQKGAIDTVNSAGLTDEERLQKTRQFIEFALAGARPESIELLKKRSDIQGILDAFGVDIGSSGKEADNAPFKVGDKYNGSIIKSVKKL